MNRIQRAITRSKELSQTPWRPTPDGPTPARIFAIGDPQTTTQKLFSVLDSHQLLGEDGMLAPDVGLVSIGDHFDYAASPEECRAEGGLFLRWLAEHPQNQTHIIAGNHDLCRVMELAPFTDASYQQAQREAGPIKEAERRGEDVTATEEAFLRRYPSIPSPGCVLKDFLGFETSQRSLVQSLLLGGRLRLSLHVTTESGHDALLTHAAITEREFFFLGLDAHQTARVRAAALNLYLQDAVNRVRDDWSSGRVHTPLSLSPVHEMGFAGQEGGGLLYHRPANPLRSSADKPWEFDPKMPRRFDPRTLPLGLLQICGHTGHSKCLTSLGAWVTPEAKQRAIGGLRTLTATKEMARYHAGILTHNPDEATLYMIDIEIHKEQAEYPLLPLRSVHP